MANRKGWRVDLAPPIFLTLVVGAKSYYLFGSGLLWPKWSRPRQDGHA